MLRLAPLSSAMGVLLLLVATGTVGCSSRERRARELVERRRLVEIIRASPTTAMVLDQTDEGAFLKACVRAIAKGLSEEELADSLRFARSALGGKEAAFREQTIRAGLLGQYPAEGQLDPARLRLARELVAADPLAETVIERVRNGIACSAAATFTLDELEQLLARAREPLAVSVQRKWPILVTQAFQEVIKSAPAKSDLPPDTPTSSGR